MFIQCSIYATDFCVGGFILGDPDRIHNRCYPILNTSTRREHLSLGRLAFKGYDRHSHTLDHQSYPQPSRSVIRNAGQTLVS